MRNTLRSLGAVGGWRMQTLQHRGVPISERRCSRPEAPPLPDWESIRIFLEVARRGSFRSAADHLGQSINALRRRITRARTSARRRRLFTRHVDGVRTTAEGEEILDAARQDGGGVLRPDQSARSSSSLARGRSQTCCHRRTGNVLACAAACRVSTRPSEAAHRSELRDAIGRRVATGSRRRRSSSTKPTNPDLKIVKLGRLHSMPFAGQSYIDTYGAPKTLEELLKHRIVLQVAEQTRPRRTMIS